MSTFVDFAEIKAQVSIEQVADWLQLKLSQTGNQLRGCCPIHKGSNPRDFVITPAKGLFYCFKCQVGGDLIKLYAEVNGIEPKAAAQAIAERLGVSDPQTRVGGREVATENTSEEKTQAQAFEPLTYLVPDHALVQKLGITSATAEHFGAGYAPKGVLRGCLAIPIHDREGMLLGYAGRSTSPINTTLSFAKGFDPEPILFNAHRCEPDSIIELRRDPLEVLLAYQYGIESNIVTFLTEHISARQIGQLALFFDDTHCCL